MTEEQYNKMLGERIHDARKAKKITLKELGRLVGLSESTTLRYEKGQIKSVDINVVKKFAEALHFPAEDLLGWAKAPLPAAEEPPPKNANDCLLEREERLIEKYRYLSSDGKTVVDAVAEAQYNIELKKNSESEAVG